MSIFEVCDTSNDECCFPIGYCGSARHIDYCQRSKN